MNGSSKAVDAAKIIVDAMASKYKNLDVEVKFEGTDGCEDVDSPVKWSVSAKVYFEEGRAVIPTEGEYDLGTPEGPSN